MKKFIKISGLPIFLIIMLISFEVKAMDGKEEAGTTGEAEFTVLGLCGMCKDRIEQAAYSVRGVRRAEWDQEEQKIQVRYRPNRTSQEEIERAIAKAGHDTANFLTSDKKYANLHHCCVYPRNPEKLESNKRYDEE